MTKDHHNVPLDHPYSGWRIIEWEPLEPGDDGVPYPIAEYSSVTFHVTAGFIELEGSVLGEKYDALPDARGLPLKRSPFLTTSGVQFVRPVNRGDVTARVSVMVRR